MSIDNGTCQLTFPWSGDLPAAETLVIRDVDIVGVGSLRRQQVEAIAKNKNFILQTYSQFIPESVQGIYQAELIKTLQWLRPVKTVTAESLNFTVEQKKLFLTLFPLTASLLGMTRERVLDHYLQEMEWSSWLFQDHWRYFVGFLRQKFSGQSDLIEVAHWEWVKAWMEIQPFEWQASSTGELQINPSLQVVNLTLDNSKLQKSAGLYAFVWDSVAGQIREHGLSPAEALLLDILQEDRVYSREQLIQRALISELEPMLSEGEWQEKMASLERDAIIT